MVSFLRFFVTLTSGGSICVTGELESTYGGGMLWLAPGGGLMTFPGKLSTRCVQFTKVSLKSSSGGLGYRFL